MKLEMRVSKEKKISRPFLVIFFLFVLVNIPSFNCGFFSDDFINLKKAEISSVFDINSYTINEFFNPFAFLFQKLEFFIFSDHYVYYQLVNYCLMFLLLLTVQKIMLTVSGLIESKKFKLVAYSSTLILCLLPYNTEVFNWYSSQHYLCATLLFLVAILFYLEARIKKNSSLIYISSGLFLLSLGFKEITIIFPLIILILDLFLFKKRLEETLKFQIILVIILIVYFLLRKLFVGNFIGGYGSEVHLNMNPRILFTNLLAYFSKFFFFHRYVNKGIRVFFYFMIPILGIILFIKKKSTIKTVFILTVLFVVSLLPVVNLETSFLHSIQSDRYGFLPGILVATIFGYIVSSIYLKILEKGTILRLFSNGMFLFLGVLLMSATLRTNLSWRRASAVRDDYKLFIKNNVHNNSIITIVNIPDNYEGVYIFRNGFDKFQNVENNKLKVNYLLKCEMQKNQIFTCTKYPKYWVFKMSDGIIYDLNYSLLSLITLNSNNIRFNYNFPNKLYLYNDFHFYRLN
jgi:hypothetical protein